MGKVRVLQSMLNAGELNPLTRGRSDTPRFHQGLERCRNAIPLVTGGTTRRAGFRFVALAANSNCRLLPLRINIGLALQGYVLEFTPSKTRFYTNGQRIMNGVNPVEIATSYTAPQITELKYEQYENVLYNVHTAHPPCTITRTSDTAWSLANIGFSSQPSVDKWSAANGYPGAISFFEQRLVLAGSSAYPTSIWGSKSGDFLTFAIGTLDSDPYEFTPAAASTRINQMVAGDAINLFTFDKEITMSAGTSSAALTPSNVQFKTRTNKGSHPNVRPVTVGGDMFFSSLSGNRYRLFSYRFDKDRYVAPDFGVFGGHLIEEGGGIAEAAFASEPHSCIWAVTNNGHLLTFTYDPDQEIYAWSRQYTEESTFYRSVCVIPDATGQDQVWIAVDREINGAVVTCVEYLDYSLNTDSAATASDATGETTWTGFSHLEGQLVDIVADGVVLPQQIVTSGTVVTDYPVKAIEVGRHYQTIIKDLPVDIANPGTTMQGTYQSIKKASVILHESMGCSINGEEIPFRQFGYGVLDTPLAPFSGVKEISGFGWSKDPADSQITIIQDKPLPMTVLAIIKEVEING